MIALGEIDYGHIVYSREQLLALRHTAVLPEASSAIPGDLLRRRRGCRAGVKHRGRMRRYKPFLPSIIMGNVRSLGNKLDELSALTRLHREFRECSIMCFTETWLNESIPDSLVALDGFHLLRADRNTTETGKKKGGGLAMFVNKRWCNPGHVTIKDKLCSKDIELLAISMRPYYLPREFTVAVMIGVYPTFSRFKCCL